jgi:DNA-binding response OmpR family regulator
MSKILIIEDEDIILEPLSEMLRGENFDVVAASSGETGLKLAATEQPDLILCDVVLTGMDGHAVLQSLRADPAIGRTPVIFLTGQASPQEIRTGYSLGADDYLCKPVAWPVMLAAIRKQLAKARPA